MNLKLDPFSRALLDFGRFKIGGTRQVLGHERGQHRVVIRREHRATAETAGRRDTQFRTVIFEAQVALVSHEPLKVTAEQTRDRLVAYRAQNVVWEAVRNELLTQRRQRRDAPEGLSLRARHLAAERRKHRDVCSAVYVNLSDGRKHPGRGTHSNLIERKAPHAVRGRDEAVNPTDGAACSEERRVGTGRPSHDLADSAERVHRDIVPAAIRATRTADRPRDFHQE